MTTFAVIGLVMALAAVACVVVPMLRGSRVSSVASSASNVAIMRGALAELDADRDRGTIDAAHYDEARAELERRVLEETPGRDITDVASKRGSTWAAVVVGAVIPVAALLIYVAVGNPDGVSSIVQTRAESSPHNISPQQIDEMLAKVVAKLEQNPQDAQGWVILARTYYALGRFREAAPAYERATTLLPDDAELLADYADTLAASQQSAAGKPMAIVQRALAIDGKQWKALALAGTFAFDQKDYAGAIVYWERLKAVAPAESEMARSIDNSLAQARALGGSSALAAAMANAAIPPAAGVTPSTNAPPAGAPAVPAATGSANSIAGTVTLAPALAAKVAPTDTVFIFARAAQGPKMPLAILRKQVKDLPFTFVLDDSMAMAPGMSLANFSDVVVGARVSKTGQAIAQSGDFQGQSPTVKTGAKGLAVVIADVVP